MPLIITILVLRFLFKGIDGLLSPFIAELIGYKVPGGVSTTLQRKASLRAECTQ
ncbi:MAG: hypothetical protein KAW02_02850 [candidate division Zixibacteria bacterium]|nr:hypothetical protein [candidate division Zixibacteria bacterium]